jgi:hypothetical protein
MVKVKLIVVGVCVFMFLPKISMGSQESEQERIKRKYDVVAWGKKQSLIDNIGRIIDAVESKGTDWTVYERRYKDLEFHWNEMKDKGIDPKKETLYFGMIDWVTKNGIGIPTDHYVQFYVAARKKNRNASVELEVDRVYWTTRRVV